MIVNLVIPKLTYSFDIAGSDELFVSETVAWLKHIKTDYIITDGDPVENADIYLFIIQYRMNLLSPWFKESTSKTNGKLTIVCGKSGAVERQYVLKQSKVDFVILGEIEKTLEEIIKSYTPGSKENIKKISGVAYYEGGKIIQTKKRMAIQNLDDLPMPEYEYLANGKYDFCVIRTSKSCHGKCNFCEFFLYDNLNSGNGYRVKSPQRICKEIEFVINKYGHRVFVITDENFFCDGIKGKARAAEFANLLISKNIKIKYTIECRADDIDYNLLKLLKKSGLCKVFVGLESGSQAVLDRYNKEITVDQNKKAIEILYSLNLKCHPGHILFDNLSTLSELKESTEFFLQYVDILYSLGQQSERTAFIPYNSGLMKKIWPNKDETFYEKQCYENDNIEFVFYETKQIYEMFKKLLHDENKYSDCNVFKKRILCLKESIDNYIKEKG